MHNLCENLSHYSIIIRHNHRRILLSAICLSLVWGNTLGNPDQHRLLDFTEAVIVCPPDLDRLGKKTVQVLVEEVEKRSGIRLKTSHTWSSEGGVIALTDMRHARSCLGLHYSAINDLESQESEGYRIIVLENAGPIVLVAGEDPRGLFYGMGRLLRNMTIRKSQIQIPSDLRFCTSPRYQIRGHQLGYRPKTNAYDAWSAVQYDQYIRELAIFGANSIEIMPPRTDDDLSSIHMKVEPMQMMIEVARIIDSYGMNVWIWYPNMGSDYTHPDSVKKEMEERDTIFKSLGRIDAVFVPGGDPGDLHPDILFRWLGQVSESLQRYHPHAKIWVSPQVFRPADEWMRSFIKGVNNAGNWLGGIVFGPWTKTPLRVLREQLKPSIPIRHYPDITHSLSCQYPVPRWDLAFAMTLGRECINPRPVSQKTIHNVMAGYTIGSISYSEGTNDDVNKFIWSDQDWDPETEVIETLRDYSRFFLGPDMVESFAQGLLSLERNWAGPVLVNKAIEVTLKQWQEMEKTGLHDVTGNYRFEMGLLRAYYDAFIRFRLIYETALESEAIEHLEKTGEIGSLSVIQDAFSCFKKAIDSPAASEYRQKCVALSDSLFRHIGAQLSVERHSAMPGRGNFIDNIDAPLNDALFMITQLSGIQTIPGENERCMAIGKLLDRTNPGPGGFYDDLGSPSSWMRVVSKVKWEEDPGSLISPRVGFTDGLIGEEWVQEMETEGFKGRTTPLAWRDQLKTLYDTPLVLFYDHLSKDKSYCIRITYTGRFRSRIRMIADDHLQIHDWIQTGEVPVFEFPIPKEATEDGILTLSWTCGEGERGAQVAEIWIYPAPVLK